MDIERYNHFSRLALLDDDQPKERRRSGKIYGTFIISPRQPGQWFANMEGIEFIAEITFTKNVAGKRMIKEVTPVRLTGSTVVRGRPLPANDVIML